MHLISGDPIMMHYANSLFICSFTYLGDAVALLVGQRTYDSQVAGSSLRGAPLRSGLGQATYTCVPLSPSSILWYWPWWMISLAGKVTTGLAKSNGSLGR